MTEPGTTSGGSTAGGGAATWWTVLVPALALVLGLVLGGVLVGVAGDDDGSEATDEATPGATPTTGAESSPASPGDTVIVVPEECIAAAETVQEATDLARRTAAAIRDFQGEELREQLRRLEELDQRARSQARACQEVEATTASP